MFLVQLLSTLLPKKEQIIRACIIQNPFEDQRRELRSISHKFLQFSHLFVQISIFEGAPKLGSISCIGKELSFGLLLQ